MQAILMNANLRARPAIIVQGRADGVVAPNHAGRAYYARNQLVEQGGIDLRYYEVINAHHFDARCSRDTPRGMSLSTTTFCRH